MGAITIVTVHYLAWWEQALLLQYLLLQDGSKHYYYSTFSCRVEASTSIQCSKLFKGLECTVLPMALCTIKNTWSHSKIRAGNSPGFGLPSVAILPWLCRKRRKAIFIYIYILLQDGSKPCYYTTFSYRMGTSSIITVHSLTGWEQSLLLQYLLLLDGNKHYYYSTFSYRMGTITIIAVPSPAWWEQALRSKTIVGQVDLTAKLCLSFCLELQSAKSTYQHVDLDL